MILIIGYGNPLRSDDAIGQRIAQIMEQRLKGEQLQVQIVYQLTPELVETISRAQMVFFIDARVGETPGKIMRETVEPEIGSSAFTHNVSPATLLSAAHELYGAKPAGVLISIVGAAFDYGSDLSAQLDRMLPTLAKKVEEIIKMHPVVQKEKENHHA